MKAEARKPKRLTPHEVRMRRLQARARAAEEISRPLRKWWEEPGAIYWVALLVRVGYITLAHTYRFKLIDDSFGFGWESGRIASALATGRGYSDPFHGHTGPTAWIAPLYPYLLAGVFKIAGVYTRSAAWITLTMNSFFSALTCLTVHEIADRIFGRKTAVWSAWLWALLPYALQYAVRWPWETCLATWLLSYTVVLSLRMKRIGHDPTLPEGMTSRNWARFGFTWGLLALSNPSVLLFLPFSGLWLLLWPGQPKRPWVQAAFAGTIFWLMLTPWIVRNYEVFGEFIPLRSNFGVEFHLGNGPDATGMWKFWQHPTQNPIEFERYVRMGETQYSHYWMRQTMDFVRSHPGSFLQTTLKRIFYFWHGPPKTGQPLIIDYAANMLFAGTSAVAFLGLALMIRRKAPAAGLIAWFMISVPFLYYITFPHPRYRHPVEPIMLILGVYLFQSAERGSPEDGRKLEMGNPKGHNAPI